MDNKSTNDQREQMNQPLSASLNEPSKVPPVNPLNDVAISTIQINQRPVEMVVSNVDLSGSSGDPMTAKTSSGTPTTSSGDDRDFTGGNAGEGTTSYQSGTGNEQHRQPQQSRISRDANRTNDGSALPVPGDDGSYQLLGGPATVVASRLPPPNPDTTTNVSSSGSGGEGEVIQDNLIQPHREPEYHTIRKTFSKLPKRAESSRRRRPKSSTTDSSSMEDGTGKKTAPKTSITSDISPGATKTKKKPSPRISDRHIVRGRSSPSPDSGGDGDEGGGSSSGSGTEGGYAGSASSNASNEISRQQESSSSSPSVSSSEESEPKTKSKRDNARKSSKRVGGGSGDSSSSSEIADFSSGHSILDVEDAAGFTIKTFTSTQPASPSLSSNEGSIDDLEETYLRAKRSVVQDQARMLKAAARKRKANMKASKTSWGPDGRPLKWPRPNIRHKEMKGKKGCRPAILTLGSDIMAHVLTFLNPPEILDVLTMPLSREWRQTFTSQPELWRVLCLVDPFKAKMEESNDSDSSDSIGSKDSYERHLLERYRLLYTSFVRCMKYLSQIREDAINGRQPSFIDYGLAGVRSNGGGPPTLVGINKSLQSFLARARGVLAESKEASSESNETSEDDDNLESQPTQIAGTMLPQRKRQRNGSNQKAQKKLRLGTSMITDRLLGPSRSGDPGSLTLPWSCAIYSIVNWMVAFLDVEGIQTLCMKVLPFLLEDEEQRMTAQRTGLTDVVLRGMVLFDQSVQLHIAAFHTIVLLARPLGGREGMLFHSSMVASGIFGGDNSQHRKNGIAVMVDSMRRFEDNEVLQAMSCWALVNIALAPAQKAVLVKLGGIQATANAMRHHPFNAEVQFRALFALINLVIPSVRLNSGNPEAIAIQEQLGEVNDITEKEIIDELVGEIADLVVTAMKNFCSSEAILNRACLVLHNLSLTQEYHTTLLWTPNCYQMLEWCLANYRTDQVLQQSASGTLHRLQMTLSNNEDLRTRFAESLQSQQQISLEQAHHEALLLHERQNEIEHPIV